MHKTFTLLATAPVLIALAAPAPVLAQEDVDDSVAYAAWRAAYDAKDAAKAISLAKDYLKKFPKGKYADYLGKWLAQQGQAMKTPLQTAMESGDANAMARLGREHMKAHPEDVTTAIQLAWNLRKHLSMASDIQGFSGQAIKLIEGGTVPKGSFKKGETLSWLYQNLGMVAEKGKKTDDALGYYAKSSSLAPGNAAIVGTNLRNSGRIYSQELNAAVKKLTDLQAAGAAEADVTAANTKLSEAADSVIDSWGRLMALAKDNPKIASLTKGIGPALHSVYAQRYPDDPDGLNKLIEGYRK